MSMNKDLTFDVYVFELLTILPKLDTTKMLKDNYVYAIIITQITNNLYLRGG